LLDDASRGDDAVTLWTRLGVKDAARVADLDVEGVRALRSV